MCGRARCTLRADDIPRACHLNGRPVRHVDTDRYRPSYNVSPGSNLPVVKRDDGANSDGVVVQCMKWGLIPSFTKKTEKPDHYKMFNARSESVTEKASFRRLLPGSRCLVAVEGFYEWKKDGSKKQPYYIHFKDGQPLVFAALYDSWKNVEGEILCTFTILTTSSSSALAWLHDRMPVILGNKGSTVEWLDGSSSSKVDTLLKPYEEPDLVWYPVTTAMGKPSFHGPECIKEAHFQMSYSGQASCGWRSLEIISEINFNSVLRIFRKQIQLKTEEMKPISSFFSKKGISGEESKPQVTSTYSGPFHPTKATTLKEELFTVESDEDSKSNVYMPTREGTTHKRDYEEFSADEKPTADETDKTHPIPVRKKENRGGTGDKQPTLFSYFGKG